MSFALHAMTMKYSGSFLPQIVPSPFELVLIFYQSLLLPSLPCVPTVSKYKERKLLRKKKQQRETIRAVDTCSKRLADALALFSSEERMMTICGLQV